MNPYSILAFNFCNHQRFKKKMKIWVAVLSFIISVVPLFLMAQNYPKDYLKVHNDARASVGVQPLKWDIKLEDHARTFVNKHVESCKLGKGGTGGRFSRLVEQNSRLITGADAVALWVETKKNYDYKSNSCTDKKNYSCVPYVKVVWGGTTLLGCARIRCHDIKKGILISCYYFPSHKFPTQRPYILPNISITK
ncbi:Pathogenesis-related protein [Arachis hypogaea]|nr:Pathogenesis-related protein [Arachis hypogaea]